MRRRELLLLLGGALTVWPVALALVLRQALAVRQSWLASVPALIDRLPRLGNDFTPRSQNGSFL